MVWILLYFLQIHSSICFSTEINKIDIRRARNSRNTFIFIYDLSALNDCGAFIQNLQEIYPLESGLNKGNLGYLKAYFLNLMITTKDKQFCSKLFNKRNSFLISVVCMPYLDSNISSKVFHSAFKVKILRSAKTTNGATIFRKNSESLINQMIFLSSYYIF